MNKNYKIRAQGCMMGQLVGDALGSLVEFKRPEDIQKQYPDGVRDLRMVVHGTLSLVSQQMTLKWR